jgi:hypothetical protein
MSRRIAATAVVSTILVAFAAASTARGQSDDQELQSNPIEAELEAPDPQAVGPSRWLPWLGCWESDTGFPTDPQSEDMDEELDADEAEVPRPPEIWVCVAPAGGDVRVTTLVDGASVHEETLRADGTQQSLETPGCSGWRAATWSKDGARLFLTSEQQCQGDIARTAGGVAFMDWRGVWFDIQAVSADDRSDVLVRRYRRLSRQQTETAGYSPPAAGPGLWQARSGVRARLSIDDVIEASSRLDPNVLEALLLANAVGFPIDSKVLVQLADAGLHPYQIDLMVALSFPERFEVVNAVPYASVTQTPGAPMAQVMRLSGGLGYGSCGYWNPFYFSPECRSFAGYDYGIDYGEPAAGRRRHGRVVKGEGYTRISLRNAADRASGGGSGGSKSSSSSSTSVSSSGYTSSSSGTGRTAKARE